MAVTNKRSVMTLYSAANDIFCHRVRIVLGEKGVAYDMINADVRGKPQELLEINPLASLPTLVDRELVLYKTNIIMEYLDERFPHPPLMPVYPVARAKARLIIDRCDEEWSPLVKKIETNKGSEGRAAANALAASFSQLISLFHSSPYFMGEEFTLVDCIIAPLLWRFDTWGIKLPASEMKVLKKYGERLFCRDSFQASLTEVEQELRATEQEECA